MGWLLWLAAALLLSVVETLTADLTLLMIAGGALGGSAASALGAPLWVQILVFALVSVLLLFAVRPWTKRRLAAATPELRTNSDALIGRKARTLTTVDGQGGRVHLEGAEWSARLDLGATGREPLGTGVEVTVVKIDGATAVVAPLGAKELR